MTPAEITAARLANRQAIRARLAAFKLPAGATPGRVDPRPPIILNPTDRAALVAAENARPKKSCC